MRKQKLKWELFYIHISSKTYLYPQKFYEDGSELIEAMFYVHVFIKMFAFNLILFLE